MASAVSYPMYSTPSTGDTAPPMAYKMPTEHHHHLDGASDPAAFNYDAYHQQQHYERHNQPLHHGLASGSASGNTMSAGNGISSHSGAAKGSSSTSNASHQSHSRNSPSASVPSTPDHDDDDKENDDESGDRNDALKSNRLCTMPGCKKRVRSKGLCKAHGGGRRCMVDGCERSSQGQGLCIRHGGGKRCTQAGCTKASQSNGLCKAHGGGLRCQTHGCTKSSQGGGYCRAHGGGQRCEKEGCNKGAQRGGFCAGHGGSRFCQHPDCTKNDRGGGYCAEHGGGKRCDHTGCNKPARKKGKCSYHANAAKGKGPKNVMASAAAPQSIMDMRQITAPPYMANAPMPKDMSAMREHHGMDHSSVRSHPSMNYQRVELDQRYPKYEVHQQAAAGASTSGQYLQIHADQRSYEPMNMQQQSASRHYMGNVDQASGLPSVSSGYSTSHKAQQQHYMPSHAMMDRNTAPGYPPARGEPMKNAQGGHHANVNPYDRQNIEFFDLKDQQHGHHQQLPPHHQPYPSASSQYHQHLSAADSAAAAAVYGNQRQPYYAQGPPSQSSSQDGMFYQPTNGSYPPQHPMQNITQVNLL